MGQAGGGRLCDSVKGDVTMAMSGQPDLNEDWQGLRVLAKRMSGKRAPGGGKGGSKAWEWGALCV